MALAIALAGCSNGPNSTFTELGQDGNTMGFGRKFPSDPNENAFTFGVGDTVVIGVADEAELTGTHVVRQDGYITLPLVRDVKVGGLTTHQIEQKLERSLALFLRNPSVTISVGNVVSKKYFVGAVNPATGGVLFSSVPYVGDTVLFDVWVAMGSPSTILDDDAHVKVIRGDPRHPRVLVVNVKDIYEKGLTGGNVQIQPDDIVFVPPTLIGKFNQLVAGFSVPFQNLFTVTRSITELDFTVRVLQGDDASFGRGRAF